MRAPALHRHTNMSPSALLAGQYGAGRLRSSSGWAVAARARFTSGRWNEAASLLGFCGLKIADTAGSPVEGEIEIGWRLREDVWGQGFAREAAAASLDLAFDQIDAAQVVAITFAENVASWGLMERLGMRRREDLDYDDPRFPGHRRSSGLLRWRMALMRLMDFEGHRPDRPHGFCRTRATLIGEVEIGTRSQHLVWLRPE